MLTTVDLKRGETLLGILHVEEYDFPWVVCRFDAMPTFEDVRPLFAAELAVDPDDMDAWGAAYDRIIGLGLELINATTGQTLGTFILHVEGEKASFRSEFMR